MQRWCLIRRFALLALLPGAIEAAPAAAQNADATNSTSPLANQLPRPGYEPHTWRFGSTEIATSLALETQYDSNIFAVPRNAVDDGILLITPRLTVEGLYGRLKASGELFGDIREYFSNSGESRASFGIAGSARYLANQSNSFSGGFRAERIAESRNDPEANTRIGLSPRLVNVISGTVTYDLEGSRFGFRLRGDIQSLDYVSAEDDERSLDILFAATRLSYIPSPGFAVFFQPYVNRRDYKLAVDRGGIDRDATTFGATAGVRLSLTGSLVGEFGLGAFRADPDDRSLSSFSGVAASADLTWAPRPRTLVILRGSSGDTATVRSGANGRIDTRAVLRVDQEVRHNILASANIGYLVTRYRGIESTLRTATGGLQVDYLLNRTVSIFADANYTRRRANPDDQSFDRTYVGIGIRLRR